MKFTALLGLSVFTCIASNDFLIPTADSEERTEETFQTPEDYKFWSRLLKDELSIPTTPPIKKSTTTPIKSPASLPVSPPIKPTVKAPQNQPVIPPITPPVKAPVTPPITSPVKTPIAPTVKAPQTLPVQPPIIPQAKSPVSLPIAPPIKSPVNPPVTPSVKVPKNPPVTPPATSSLLCDIDVIIDCVTSEDLPCNELQPPNPVCSGSDVVAVTFGYSGNACNPAGNSQGAEAFCEDIGTIDTSVSVTILCRDANVITTGLVVEPPTIPLGGVFTISAPSGNLPEKVDCIILDSAETQLQQIVIDTSGDVSLNLRDEFGAFTLLACGDGGVGGVQSCLETLSYTIDINNVGTVGMEVTTAEFIFDGITTSFVSDIDTNILPGESSTIETRQTIDLCVVAEYCAEINVVANPPNGNECQDTDQYCFQVSQLPPAPIVAPAVPPASVPSAPIPTPRTLPIPVPVIQAPVKAPVGPIPVPAKAPIPQSIVPSIPTKPPVPVSCILEVSSTCVIAGSSSSAGKSCDTPSLGIEPCLERPLQITMLYNGGDCSQSDNDQLLKFTCEDSNGGPPTAEGASSYIIVTDIREMGITYFQGTVPIGSQYILGDGVNRVEADMIINIFSPDRTTLLQSVQYHSSCSSTLELKNRFGASQIVQYYNTLQGNVSCFADFSFSADIEVPISTGGDNVTLTSLVANTNFAGKIDLTGQVAGVVVSPGGTVQVTLQGTIDASIRRMYVIMFEILGVKSSGTVCTGSDTLSFEAGSVPGAPSPASLPTAPTSKTKKGPLSPGVLAPSSSGSMSSGSMSMSSKSSGS